MRKSHTRLPSPAMVVGLTALFLTLGGTGYAASQLTKGNDNGADKHLVKHLAPHLSVAHATTANTANSAANASNATKVNGLTVQKIHFVQVTGDNATHQILSLGDLILDVNCHHPGGPVTVTAKSTTGGAEVHVDLQANHEYSNGNSDSNGDTFTDQTGGDKYLEEDNLAAGTPMDVVDVLKTQGDSVIAHLEYADPAGHFASVNFMSEQDAMSTHVDCLVSGVAMGS